MNIKDASALCGLPAKTIRYYEDIGLVSPARSSNGYRHFSGSDTHKLIFLARARSLGFSIEDCRSLLSLYENRDRASADVKRVADAHLERIAAKIDELQALSRTLGDLVSRCQGTDRPDCPILDGIADEAGQAPRSPAQSERRREEV
ncbi:MerR family DNA-binding protein [Roseicyclus sp. F158]|uniref:MerR family DNA-binding protein n=1 Tax=Tropicimonas omnivorans TaxID=3075590 RepID=A0ABU3DL61_9RHOB|nr:MerR family DNA-binding protein [Roseicyclus sp. F158]MDT0684450.1 MerR family DNA-binding protein [Roseicyclus sp. F158]